MVRARHQMSAPTPVRPPTDRDSGEVSFDVVVVGGRCAGAATALLLARAGLRVLVADRSAEGSDTLSGHMIKPDGVGRLGVWGVLPDLLAGGCPPITGAEFVLDGHLEPRPEPRPGAVPPMAPRRTVLDRLMQQQRPRSRRARPAPHQLSRLP